MPSRMSPGGRSLVTSLYPKDYAALMNRHEAPKGKGYVVADSLAGVMP